MSPESLTRSQYSHSPEPDTFLTLFIQATFNTHHTELQPRPRDYNESSVINQVLVLTLARTRLHSQIVFLTDPHTRVFPSTSQMVFSLPGPHTRVSIWHRLHYQMVFSHGTTSKSSIYRLHSQMVFLTGPHPRVFHLTQTTSSDGFFSQVEGGREEEREGEL